MKPKPVTTVMNDKLCIVYDGARACFTEHDLVKIVAKAQAELYQWQLRLEYLRKALRVDDAAPEAAE